MSGFVFVLFLNELCLHFVSRVRHFESQHLPNKITPAVIMNHIRAKFQSRLFILIRFVYRLDLRANRDRLSPGAQRLEAWIVLLCHLRRGRKERDDRSETSLTPLSPFPTVLLFKSCYYWDIMGLAQSPHGNNELGYQTLAWHVKPPLKTLRTTNTWMKHERVELRNSDSRSVEMRACSLPFLLLLWVELHHVDVIKPEPLCLLLSGSLVFHAYSTECLTQISLRTPMGAETSQSAVQPKPEMWYNKLEVSTVLSDHRGTLKAGQGSGKTWGKGWGVGG